MSFLNRVKTLFTKSSSSKEELPSSTSPKEELGNKPIPTVRPAVPFDVVQQLGTLHAFIQSGDTNSEKYMQFLIGFSIDQRQTLLWEYYAENNSKVFEYYINFEMLQNALVIPRWQYLCKHLHKALSREPVDILTLIEILCTISHSDMTEILYLYKDMYGRSLLEHIRERTFGKLRSLFAYLVTEVRSPPLLDDTSIARYEAQTMYDASNGKLAIKEDVLFYWLAENSLNKLQTRFEEYEKLWGHSLYEAIEREMGDDIKTALLAMVECVQSPPAFFATRLFKAMDGAGTDDTTLIRIIVSRSEIDLGNIKEEFERLYNRTLVSAVKSETSGDYKRALCALIGGA